MLISLGSQKIEYVVHWMNRSIEHLISGSEFQRHLGLVMPKTPPVKEAKPAVIPQIILPAEYDWRTFNVVTPVKNQVKTNIL